MASNLAFLNKNLFRKYPFQASASLISTSGVEIPLDLIASVSIAIPLTLSNLYMEQLILNNGTVSISFAHWSGTAATTIGCFTGVITEDFQTLELESFVPFASGFLVMGGVTNIQQLQGFYTFNYANAVLEPNTVFCYSPPAVTSLNSNGAKIQGNLSFGTLQNLTLTQSGSIFEFDVTSTSTITSLADFSSEFRNCPTPCITNINGIVPYTPDVTSANDNNIYLFGVDPITFDPVLVDPDASPESYTINITTPGFDLNSLCAQRSPLLPPVAPAYVVNRAADEFVGISRYYTKSQTPIVNFPNNILPEYLLWPNFVSMYSTTLVNPANGTHTVFDSTVNTPILTSGQSGKVVQVYIATSTGTVSSNFNLLNSSTTTTIVPSTAITDEGAVILPTIDGTFVPTTKFTVDLTSISGSITYSIIVFYNIIVD